MDRVLFLVCCLVGIALASGEEVFTGVSLAEIEDARNKWISAVEALDKQSVVALYHPTEGKLLGTVDTSFEPPQARNGPVKIDDYFEGFLAKDGIQAKFLDPVDEEHVQQLGAGYAAYSGYYDFVFKMGSKTTTGHAKFTYIYKRTPSGLLIVTHNSGFTPEVGNEGFITKKAPASKK